jgi:hypothetical protein
MYSKSFTSRSSCGVETENELHQNNLDIKAGQPECQTCQRTLSIPNIYGNAEASNLNVCGMESINTYWLSQWRTLQTC